MARTGSFGRLPRTAPDLSSTIISMLREYENIRERNIENAWENGGLFEGKKVTDSMLLDFYKGRRDDLDPDDPLWQEYDQKVSTLGYAIRESRMSLKYAQKKVTEAQMAAFYRSEAAKLPVDSEAYRQLMRNAAQFADAVRSNAVARRSSGRARATAAATTAVAVTHSEVAYEFVYATLLNSARDRGILRTPDAKGNNGQDFDDLVIKLENDPARMMELVDDFDAEIQASKGDPNGLYAQMVKMDPSFRKLDATYLTGLTQKKVTAANQRAEILYKAGKKAEGNKALKEAAKAGTAGAFIAGMDELAAYSLGRETFDTMMSNAKTPDERREARVWWAGELSKLAAGVGKGSPYLGPLQNEIGVVTGTSKGIGLSLWDSPAGTGDAAASPKSDLAEMNEIFVEDDMAVAALADGSARYIQGNWDRPSAGGPRVFTPSADGTTWGTTYDTAKSGIKPETLAAADMQVTAVVRPDGTIVAGYVPTRNIMVSARSGSREAGSNPITGESTDEGFKVDPQINTQLIGKVVTTVDGVTLYGIYARDGSGLRWTSGDFVNTDVVTGVPVRDMNGDLIVTMNITGPEKVYDPFVAADEPLINPDLTHTQSYSSFFVAEHMATDEKKQQLLQIKPDKVGAILDEEARGDPARGMVYANEYADASADAFYGPANARSRDSLRRSLPKFLPDEVDERVSRAMNQTFVNTRVTGFTGESISQRAIKERAIKDNDPVVQQHTGDVFRGGLPPVMTSPSGKQYVTPPSNTMPRIKLPDLLGPPAPAGPQLTDAGRPLGAQPSPYGPGVPSTDSGRPLGVMPSPSPTVTPRIPTRPIYEPDEPAAATPKPPKPKPVRPVNPVIIPGRSSSGIAL